MDLDVEITAEPEELRSAIDRLGDRERACLHRIHEELDDDGPTDVRGPTP